LKQNLVIRLETPIFYGNQYAIILKIFIVNLKLWFVITGGYILFF